MAEAFDIKPVDGITRCDYCGKGLQYFFHEEDRKGNPDKWGEERDGVWAHVKCYEENSKTESESD